MSEVTYRIVEHESGWAYKVGDVFSETFSSRAEALDAARRAAAEQKVPGATEGISYEDDRGFRHKEIAEGDDRPDAHVEE